MVRRLALLIIMATGIAAGEVGLAQNPVENDFYKLISVHTSKSAQNSRAANWKPAPEDLALEVSGIAVLDDDRVAVVIRKGEIWILKGVFDDPPTNVEYHQFAAGLHEPLGLIWQDEAFYTVQRTELTRIRDTSGDGLADQYSTITKGWGVTGHYHEYAYGPELDGEGNLWLTLNIGLGLRGDQLKRAIHEPILNVTQGRWRGWGMKLTPDGELIPVCAGMRSPSGLGANQEGDMFYTDQQGNWVATNSLHHMRDGAFYHHPEALASMNLPGSPIDEITAIPEGVPFPEAVQRLPQMRPPAVWFPYKKVGQSPTDILLDASDGKFGPFSGQLFVGEFTLSSVHRVFLEKVDGEYQGAVFPFRSGFASAVLRLGQGADGSMLAGLSNRGWSSLGTASYGLQRLVWTGQTPFEIQEMRALPDGFDLKFTRPVDLMTASDVASYAMTSHTYLYHGAYGSDEIQKQDLEITKAQVSEDGLSVRLTVSGLRKLFVHELRAEGIRSRKGDPLLHPDAYYTLNKVPQSKAP
ncbi:hypothetical protein [Blastopirellula marina]|uniref:Putative large multi-functional protein n=1 Tax=Blastopirellula marina DSM 3645 TaxID=314230 RepID=A3ZYT0_9BACT|nr:hypothetical protein [Blastopirellula marina]EAQ78291.1 putative large multi-functional protein [Blastopirellula marina DSM 3645]